VFRCRQTPACGAVYWSEISFFQIAFGSFHVVILRFSVFLDGFTGQVNVYLSILYGRKSYDTDAVDSMAFTLAVDMDKYYTKPLAECVVHHNNK